MNKNNDEFLCFDMKIKISPEREEISYRGTGTIWHGITQSWACLLLGIYKHKVHLFLACKV